jgi:hypothetical protein
MKKFFLTTICAIFALAITFNACNKETEEGTDQKAKGGSGLVWNGEADKAVAANIEAEPSLRKNASGPKITSNAHSKDFPGIYFIWDSKQKDNGYLKVSADVFENYICFTLTSKEANTYWDFVIYPQLGQEMTADNCFVFYIPKVYNNKNINMVFIGETREKTDPNDPPVIPGKPESRLLPDGLEYIIISSPTLQAGAIVDKNNQWQLNGQGEPIKQFWSNTISAAYPTQWASMMAIETDKGLKANWIWDREDSWIYGISGAQYLLYVCAFNVEGTINETSIPFYFACDNAAVVYVNGQKVACTEVALQNRFVPEYGQAFNGCSDADFDGNEWQYLYQVDIRPYMVNNAHNEIKVLAANSDDNNGTWNRENNPAGLIFASKFSTTIPVQ